MEETEDMLQDISLMQPDMIYLMEKQPHDRESQEYNKWTVDVMRAALLKVDDYDVSRDISSCAKYLNTYNSALEVNTLLLSRDVIKYLAEKHRLEGENKETLTEMERELFKNLQNLQKTINVKGKNTDNPNMRILSDTLRKMMIEKGDDSRAMVFVKTRATCRSLAEFLDRDLQSSGVKASPLYGKENRGGDDGMTESQQTEILDKFRSGFFKVLVCTSVGNEGIDVPDCNIVLSYEYSGDEITKIQMKGRSRKKKATTITMGSDIVVEQEMINTYKAAMMYRAMNIVKQLDPKYINMKVNAFQSEETHKYRFKAAVEKLKKGRKSDEDYEILCGRCNTFACYVSDVWQLGHDHIVIDKDFADKITRKEHKKPNTYDGLHNKYKMYCRKCRIDWGNIGLRDGLECIILKIINFKFKNLRTHGLSTYNKWIDVPYAVPEISFSKLQESLPVEVLKMDNESIKLYKEALETGKTRAYTIRVMVVGHMGVGKTTLTKRLFGENVDVSLDNKSTNSIDVHVRKCKVILKDGNWLSLTDGDSERNHNSHIVSELLKWSREKHMKSNEDTLQSHQNEAETTQNRQEELLYTRTRVDDGKREVNETVTNYENNGTRSEEKSFSPECDREEARNLEFMTLIQDTVIGSMNESNVTEDTADLSVWDFAGQHIFYGTHQIFLSRRAVYLLVIDLSKHVDSVVEDDCFIGTDGKKQYKISEFVKFWLNSIHTYCPSSTSKEPPVILVGTFADKLGKEREKHADKIFSDLREMLTDFEELYEHLTPGDIPIDNSIKDRKC
ncbi:antiviral innate immune response receptor RIG-I-like [Ruditapes philippinarum]|uniref:antiviral innate immune response receptor RIG-I-like n=1 Tax=Ruditapes philippinarum TaxID=129788 RepID=UPI00295A9657|nr:antiviral innate immune response receptor RIG-I-like [Ruditapes philippinarum]